MYLYYYVLLPNDNNNVYINVYTSEVIGGISISRFSL